MNYQPEFETRALQHLLADVSEIRPVDLETSDRLALESVGYEAPLAAIVGRGELRILEDESTYITAR
jgi:hypothetical protein